MLVVELDIIPYSLRNAIGRNVFLPTPIVKPFVSMSARFNGPCKEVAAVDISKKHVVITDNLFVDDHNQ